MLEPAPYEASLFHAVGTLPLGRVVYLTQDRGSDYLTQVDPALHRTLLHRAAVANRADVVQYLLVSAADPNAVDRQQRCPIDLTTSVAVARILVEHNAMVQHMAEGQELAIHFACHSDNLEMLDFLLQHTADVNAQASFLLTPLHYAARESRIHAVRALLDAQANVNAKTRRLATPLHYAVHSAPLSMVELLLDRRADAFAIDVCP
jgi:ankyrin repeat protein